MNQAITTLRERHLRWHHGLANLCYVLGMHVALIAWLWSGRHFVAYPAFLALSVLGCLLHQRQLSEWFHEATHWNLVPARRWNDALADLLLGVFNGTRVRSNRPSHFRHHAATVFFTRDDPDTRGCAAATRGELLRGLLRDLAGVSALRAFLTAARGEDGAVPGARPGLAWFVWLAILHGAGLAATVFAGRADIYPLYFLTQLSLYPVANRFRLYAHHAEAVAGGGYVLNASPVSRNYHAGLIEQVLLHSPVIMYHRAHHQMPSLPYRGLRALARRDSDPNVFGESGLRLVAGIAGGLPR